ncbi:Transcription factor Pcc1 [Rhynchospora pubera]|uniref:Transcription factor Pcc1 n=1 Tax=Rhynchospora pubera TaxID=906938 RepID=A0AAV8F491_9POAL|nr:Transcription factor Pcc1 [Rhynchospora pubera]
MQRRLKLGFSFLRAALSLPRTQILSLDSLLFSLPPSVSKHSHLSSLPLSLDSLQAGSLFFFLLLAKIQGLCLAYSKTADHKSRLLLPLQFEEMAITSSPWDFSCDFEVDFGSLENASIAYAALAVDKELQPDKVKREISVSDGKIFVHFEAVEARFLRASFSSLVDLLVLATQFIEEYGGIPEK